MSDDTQPLAPYLERAAYIAAEPGATFRSVLAEGAGVMAALKENYPDRYEALRAADARWTASGRSPHTVRTAPVQTTPNPRPAPAEPVVNVPDPASIKSMRDLTQAGAAAFNAFQEQHPDEYAELARAAGMPVRS
ncbi:MAG: hypothetical protein ACYC4P_11610 [Thermoanaerobaculia bacterium]